MTLPNRTIDIITGELRLALRCGTADILDIGRLLAEAKEKMPHGEWLPWLKNEVSMSERSAQKYIKATDFAAKYELGADLDLSPSALFLVSRYNQREIAEAIVKAAKENHLGCDRARKIIDKTLEELDVADETHSEEGSTGSAQQHARPRSGVNPGDFLLLRFTTALRKLHDITKTHEADRFLKCAVEANIFAELGRLLTDVSIRKNSRADKPTFKTSLDPVRENLS